MPEEVILKYAGQSSNKNKDKKGNITAVHTVRLASVDGRYKLSISDGDESIFDTYDENCELPIQLGKNSQTKL